MAVGWSIDFHTFPPTFTSGTESSQYWRLMAIVVIYGLSVSTLLTLVLVPCLYFQIENWVAGIRRRFGFSEK
jgi:Cu/Ag efflux pump CusA